MKRFFLLLLALVLLGPAALGEEAPSYDWRADWEESGYDQYADVQDDTLIVFEGVTALGEALEYRWDFELDTKMDDEFPGKIEGHEIYFYGICKKCL